MDKYELTTGKGRTKVSLLAYYMGSDLVVSIYNENAHVGAVAVAEYDHKEKRTSCSAITRLGHRDDVLAQEAAHSISKHTKKPVCIIAGIHIDNITRQEMDQVLENTSSLVGKFLSEIVEIPSGLCQGELGCWSSGRELSGEKAVSPLP